jgi:hypothetical protein
MRPSNAVATKAILTVALACLANFAPAQQAQPSDQVVAERVLGPQWRRLSRRAGIIFAGTVLASPTHSLHQNMTDLTAPIDHPAPGAAPTVRSIELSFRVDHAIAGVEPGQTLTIHEWAGASSMQRRMIKGQHILLFLYAPSRLGLTSPVGGSQGQIALDASGENVAVPPPAAIEQTDSFASRSFASQSSASQSFALQPKSADAHPASILQLERAIRSARIAEARIGEE